MLLVSVRRHGARRRIVRGVAVTVAVHGCFSHDPSSHQR